MSASSRLVPPTSPSGAEVPVDEMAAMTGPTPTPSGTECITILSPKIQPCMSFYANYSCTAIVPDVCGPGDKFELQTSAKTGDVLASVIVPENRKAGDAICVGYWHVGERPDAHVCFAEVPAGLEFFERITFHREYNARRLQKLCSTNPRIGAIFDNGTAYDANDWCVQMRRYLNLHENIEDEAMLKVLWSKLQLTSESLWGCLNEFANLRFVDAVREGRRELRTIAQRQHFSMLMHDEKHTQEKEIQSGKLTSALDQQEREFLYMRTIAPSSFEEREKILLKVCLNPHLADVRYVLRATCADGDMMVHRYTEEAHKQLKRLLPALCDLIHDVDNVNEETTKPPVVAIGHALHALGGIETMRAVYYAIVPLLSDQVAHCDDGSVWIQVETALSMAWSGVGEWVV